MSAVALLACSLLAGLGAWRLYAGKGSSSEAPDADRPRGRWPAVWLAWAVLSLGSFGLIEGLALGNGSGGDTLTEQVQWLGGYAPWALVVLVVGFAAWLVDHFVGRTSRIWRYREWRAARRSGRETGGR